MKMHISTENLIGMALSVVLAFVIAILLSLFSYHCLPWAATELYSVVNAAVKSYKKFFADLEAEKSSNLIMKVNYKLTIADFQSNYLHVKPVIFLSRNGPQRRLEFVNIFNGKKYAKERFCLLDVHDQSIGTSKGCRYVTLDEFRCISGLKSCKKALITSKTIHYTVVGDHKIVQKILKENNKQHRKSVQQHFLSLPPSLPESLMKIRGDINITIAFENDDAMNIFNGHPADLFQPITIFTSTAHLNQHQQSSHTASHLIQMEIEIASNVTFLSGTTFHTQPTSYWSELLHGQKQWFFYKHQPNDNNNNNSNSNYNPNLKIRFNPFRNLDDWIENVLPTLKSHEMPMQAVQESGQVIYIPKGWFHACKTLSQESISISGKLLK